MKTILKKTDSGIRYHLYRDGKEARLTLDMEVDGWNWILDQMRPTSDAFPKKLRDVLNEVREPK